jgi:hypothetical protein
MNDKKLKIKFANSSVKGDFVEYTILINDSNNEAWTITARYSQLRNLHKNLQEKVPANVILPEFPPKKWLGNTAPSFISQRLKALENYFNNILANEQLRGLQPFTEFIFNSPRNPGTTKGSILKKDGEIENKGPGGKKQDQGNNGFKKDDMQKGMANLGFLNIVEAMNKKFFNLTYDLQPPSDDDYRKKKLQYEKIKVEVVGGNQGTTLPAGKEENLITVKDETVVKRNPALMKILFDTTDNIRSDFWYIAQQYKSKEIIHFLNTQ